MILAYDHITTAGAEKPTLVFVHAYPMNRTMWRPQLEALAGVANLVAVDVRGFGGSTAPENDDGAWNVAMWGADLLETLDHLEVEKAIFAGCSMGGYIVFEVLRRAPGRVAGVALVDTRAEADTEQARATRQGQMERMRAEGNRVMVDWALEKLLCEATHASRPDVVRQVEAIAASTPVETMLKAMQALADRPDSRPVLGTIHVPTLVLVGRHDVVTPPEVAQSMADAVAGAQMVGVAAAGHLVSLENPAAVNEALGLLVRAVAVDQAG